MRPIPQYTVGTLLFVFALVASPALAQEPNNDGEIAQANNTQSECDAVAAEEGLGSLTAFAKLDDPSEPNGGWESDLPGDDDEITFDPNPPTVPSGSWESTVSIEVFILKQARTLYYWLDPGTSLDYVAPVSDWSHFTFCTIETLEECDLPTLTGEDIINNEDRTLTNTIQDDDGIKEFSFTTLDNFTVSSITPSSGFTRTDDTWMWTGTGDPPTEVTFVLQAGPDGSATYFLEVTDNCEDENTVTFDPTYKFSTGTQPRLQVTGPNPFSGQTTLNYALTEQSVVTVSVYDVMGRKVSTLVDGEPRPTGTHTITWNGRTDDGRNLASGVYLMRMQAGDQSVTQRVTLVR